MRKTRRSTAYWLGYSAHYDRGNPVYNPGYRKHSKKWNDWFRGLKAGFAKHFWVTLTDAEVLK